MSPTPYQPRPDDPTYDTFPPQAAEPPKLRLLANRILVRVHTQPGEGTSEVVAVLAVDREGHVDFERSDLHAERALSRLSHPNSGIRPTGEDAREAERIASEALARIDADREVAVETLEAAGIIELREVGPEDSEWFLTREARALVPLTDLGQGWRRWPI